MGITVFTQEFASPVPPHRMFKALILDSHNLGHKLMPQAVHSIDIVQGNGGPRTIKKINFAKGTILPTNIVTISLQYVILRDFTVTNSYILIFGELIKILWIMTISI